MSAMDRTGLLYRLAQGHRALAGLLVQGLDGRWHHAYVERGDGTFGPSSALRAAQAAGDPHFRSPDLDCDGRIIPLPADFHPREVPT